MERRKSLRLAGYDYSRNNVYFVTVCVHNMSCLLGTPVGAALCGRLDSPGGMVQHWLLELERKFPDVYLDAYAIMPNHIHFILWNVSATGDHAGSPLPAVMEWFKTMTTNAYIRGVREGRFSPFTTRFWQRGYYEHIIRNEAELFHIRQYIAENPRKWRDDEYFA